MPDYALIAAAISAVATSIILFVLSINDWKTDSVIGIIILTCVVIEILASGFMVTVSWNNALPSGFIDCARTILIGLIPGVILIALMYYMCFLLMYVFMAIIVLLTILVNLIVGKIFELSKPESEDREVFIRLSILTAVQVISFSIVVLSFVRRLLE